MTTVSLSEWLTQIFLEWQMSTGRNQTITAFAKHIGISTSYLSMIMCGERSTIGMTMTNKIAARFGPEIYDILGLERPDIDLVAVNDYWPKLTKIQRHAIREQVEQFYNIKEETL